jgi:DNA repair exonuclease SbcCD ATPase subunit
LFRPQAMADFPGPFASRVRRVAEELRLDWERTSRDAAENRRIQELHETREDYQTLLKGHLRLLEDYLRLTELHQRLFGSNPLWTEELNQAVEELKKLHDELFPRWKTSEDLAQLLIEKYTPTPDQLRSLALKNPPPISWLEETADPFSSE